MIVAGFDLFGLTAIPIPEHDTLDDTMLSPFFKLPTS